LWGELWFEVNLTGFAFRLEVESKNALYCELEKKKRKKESECSLYDYVATTLQYISSAVSSC